MMLCKKEIVKSLKKHLFYLGNILNIENKTGVNMEAKYYTGK